MYQNRYQPMNDNRSSNYPTHNQNSRYASAQGRYAQAQPQPNYNLRDIEFYVDDQIRALAELGDRNRPIGEELIAQVTPYRRNVIEDALTFFAGCGNSSMGPEKSAAMLAVMKNCVDVFTQLPQLEDDFRIMYPHEFKSFLDAADIYCEITGQHTHVVNNGPRSLARSSVSPTVVRGGVDSAGSGSGAFVGASPTVVRSSDIPNRKISRGRTIGRRFDSDEVDEAINGPKVVRPQTDPNDPNAPRGQGPRRNAPTKASFTPVNRRPPDQPVKIELPQPEIIHQTFEDGDDEMFNMVAKQAIVTSVEKTEEAHARQAELSDNFDGVVEELGDYTTTFDFDALFKLEGAELERAVDKLIAGKAVGTLELYDPIKHRTAHYPEELPFPLAINPLTHRKIVVVENGVIRERILERTDVELKDHVDDYAESATEGRRVDIAGIIRGVAQRVPTDKNKTAVPADPENGIEAVMATADELAFPTTVINSSSAAVGDISRNLLSKSLGVAIEGMNERRITPFLVDEEFKTEIKALFRRIGASLQFTVLHSIVEKFCKDHPSEFSRALNARLTGYFNNVLRFAFALPISITDFVEDYLDARDEILNVYGKEIGMERMTKEFMLFRKTVCADASDFTDFDTVLPASLLGEDYHYVALIDTIATVTLPFSSTDADAMLPNVAIKTLAVTRSQTPTLVALIENMSKVSANAFGRLPDQLRLVTSDNVVFYVYRGTFSNGDVFVVSRDNRAVQ